MQSGESGPTSWKVKAAMDSSAQTVEAGETVYNENQGAYSVLAEFCGYAQMEDILSIFVEKLL